MTHSTTTWAEVVSLAEAIQVDDANTDEAADLARAVLDLAPRRYMHCGWEPDESGDSYARPGEQKSVIVISVTDADGYPDDEVACIVHRHVGPLDEAHPSAAVKMANADLIVRRLNGEP